MINAKASIGEHWSGPSSPCFIEAHSDAENKTVSLSMPFDTDNITLNKKEATALRDFLNAVLNNE